MSRLDDFRVAILATHGFEDCELLEPMNALEYAGARVSIIALEPGKIQGIRNDLDRSVMIKVDRRIQDVCADEFDAVHLPGGTINADSLRMVPEVQSFLRAMETAGKPMTAICHAPWELVSAGLVRGRTLTSYHTLRDDIRNAGGLWVDREVVVDRNWLTSRHPGDLPSFIRGMIAHFSQSSVLTHW